MPVRMLKSRRLEPILRERLQQQGAWRNFSQLKCPWFQCWRTWNMRVFLLIKNFYSNMPVN